MDLLHEKYINKRRKVFFQIIVQFTSFENILQMLPISLKSKSYNFDFEFFNLFICSKTKCEENFSLTLALKKWSVYGVTMSQYKIEVFRNVEVD